MSATAISPSTPYSKLASDDSTSQPITPKHRSFQGVFAKTQDASPTSKSSTEAFNSKVSIISPRSESLASPKGSEEGAPLDDSYYLATSRAWYFSNNKTPTDDETNDKPIKPVVYKVKSPTNSMEKFLDWLLLPKGTKITYIP